MCGERAQTRRNEQKRDETTFVRCYRQVMIVLAFQLLSEATLKTPQPLTRPPLRPTEDLGPVPRAMGGRLCSSLVVMRLLPQQSCTPGHGG